MRPSCHVDPLGTASPEPARLGGKGASLCRLVRLGHRVPPGIVVTREAFLATIEHLELSAALRALAEALAGAGAFATAGAQVRHKLLSGRIPPPVLGPIVRAIE